MISPAVSVPRPAMHLMPRGGPAGVARRRNPAPLGAGRLTAYDSVERAAVGAEAAPDAIAAATGVANEFYETAIP